MQRLPLIPTPTASPDAVRRPTFGSTLRPARRGPSLQRAAHAGALACCALVLAALPVAVLATPYTQTFQQIEGGVNLYVGPDPTPFRCNTAGPDGSTAGTVFASAGSSRSDGNSNCSIGGVQRLLTDTTPGTGLATDSASFSSTFNNAVFTATTSARAGSGIVGASASVTYNAGFTNNQTTHAAEAFGAFGETLTIGGATGNGWVMFGFDIDGTLTGLSDAAMEAVYRSPSLGTATWRLVSGSAGSNYGGQGLFDPFTGRAAGFAVTASPDRVVTVSGEQTFRTVLIPITFGQDFDFEFGLLTVASEWRGTSAAQFSSTARLSSVEVFTSAGALANPTIRTASGAIWTTQGLQAPEPPTPNPVPAPATWTLLLAATVARGAMRPRTASSIRP